MKKKVLQYLDNYIKDKNLNENFIFLVYYFFNSQTDNTKFSIWSEKFMNVRVHINGLFDEHEKNNASNHNIKPDSHDYGFFGFLNKCKTDNNVDDLEYERYFYLANTIHSHFYPNLFKFFNDILKIIPVKTNSELLTKYYPDYQSPLLDNNTRKSIRDLSFELLQADKVLYDELVKLSWDSQNIKERTPEILKNYKSQFNNLNKKTLLHKAKSTNLYNVITSKDNFNATLFKKSLSSNTKGIIGEQIFADLIGGTVVGNLGNKEDVVLDSENYSIKTTYRNIWNNHLAYISDKSIADIFLSDKKLSSFKNKVENFNDLIISFFTGNSELTSLVLQTVKMDIINKNVIESTQYIIPIENLKQVINNSSYFFHNSELILVHNNEQFLKISFKERSHTLQIMLSTDVDSLETLVQSKFANKEHSTLPDTIPDIKESKIKTA